MVFYEDYLRRCDFETRGEIPSESRVITSDDVFDYMLDLHMLANMQFKEITEEEFNQMARLFQDDRDDREFKVTRYLDADELQSRKRSERKNLIKTGGYLTKENVTVMAKDSEEAMNKCTNAIEVESC